MNFYPRRRRKPEIIIISLIDIFAILLIFVIVTTTFKQSQPEVTINLPEAKSAVAAEKTSEPVMLSIAENEEIYLDARRVSIGELAAEIKKLVEEKGRPNLAMKADKKVSYGFLIKVLDALKDAGVKGNLSAITEAKR